MGSYVLFILTCCVFLPVNHFANGFEYDDKAVERGDDYIDKILKDMFEDRVEEYDPYRIEDSSVGFHKKVGFFNVSGEAKLHSGYITGLKTLHRPDHCSLKEENGRLKVEADLGAGELDFRYSGTVKFMSVGPTVTVYGKLAYVEVHMEFDVDSQTGKDGKLRKFIIDDMRGMKVWVTGLGPLNWAVNPIVSGVTVIFKRFLKNFLENQVEKHIAENIKDFQFPIDDVTTQTEPTEPTTIKPETEQTETEPQTTKEPETEQTETEPQTTNEPETEQTETEPQTTSEPEIVQTTETEKQTEETNEPTDEPVTDIVPTTLQPTEEVIETEVKGGSEKEQEYIIESDPGNPVGTDNIHNVPKRDIKESVESQPTEYETEDSDLSFNKHEKSFFSTDLESDDSINEEY